MSVRVIARIRPLLKTELDKDVIVSPKVASGDGPEQKTIIRIPNPRIPAESFSFQFNSVYDQETTQAQLFENEVSPTVKHLFKGYDATIFAYGVTGTGKTHTMRGGKVMAERGVIPRLLSGIYRRARKTEKDSAQETRVEVMMSYYEIYNDKVFDLFEPPEKRAAAGLPIRDNEKGKAIVAGLTERPCATLKEFEQLYDQANVNRSTSATKLNAHSSRSHAILSVKISQTTGNETRASTASAIDLAGSEDNRRTENNKDRMVESAAINKSLFVLAQCVEAISKRQARIPYRESKMTRVLALGQNMGRTIMILNLAPVKSYHLDTLSSLNFANRTKKIEVNEIENQPFSRDIASRKVDGDARPAAPAPTMNRQPLRPKILSHNSHLKTVTDIPKPTKSFSVFSDKPTVSSNLLANASVTRIRSPKRPGSDSISSHNRPNKSSRTDVDHQARQAMSTSAIEALIERKVSEALAERVDSTTVLQADPLSEAVQRRLDALEKRVEGQENERAEGLQYLLMAKQHRARGEDASALKMYQIALPFFPENEKLSRKISALQEKIAAKSATRPAAESTRVATMSNALEDIERPCATRRGAAKKTKLKVFEDDESYCDVVDSHAFDEDGDFDSRPRTKLRQPITQRNFHTTTSDVPVPSTAEDSSDEVMECALASQSPRTKHLLHVINSRDISQITLLKGVGKKRAEGIVNAICNLEEDVGNLGDLRRLNGIGGKMVEKMRIGLSV